MAEKERKKNRSMLQDAGAGSRNSDRPSSKTTVEASTHRPGSAESHSRSSHRVTTGSRTRELRLQFERNDSKDSGLHGQDTKRQRTNPVETNPECRRITVSSTGPVTDKPPLAPPTSSDRGKSGFTVLSKIPTKSGHDPVVRQKSKPGDTGGTATRPQIAPSPPMSPPPDKSAARQRPRLGSGDYNILPSQTNPSGAAGTSTAKESTTTGTATETAVTKGLTTSNVGATGLSSSSKAGTDRLKISVRPPSPQGAGHLSLPSPTTSSGNLSSGEIFSSGDRLSSGEHPIAQANSLDGDARVVGGITYGHGHCHSSFGINPRTYNRTGTEQREASAKAATGTGSPQSSLATVSHSTLHLSQASIRAAADEDTLVGGEERACHDKLLLTTNSIGMSETGRPVYRMSMSEGGAVAVGVQHQLQLQSKINELESRNTELQRQLNLQHEIVGGGELPREDGSLEQAYTRREYVDHLVSEVKRLEPLEKEVEKLQRQLKHMDEVHADAQKRDQQLCEQVTLVSLKEAEITELKRQLSAAGENQQVSGSRIGISELAEIARLKEELTEKEREIARVRARLKKQEKTKSVEEAEGDSTSTPPPTAGDIGTMQAEYERKLQHKETMISRLKERVTTLTEAAQQSGQGDGDSEDTCTTQDTSEEVEFEPSSMAMASSGVSGDVLDDRYLESSENVDKEVVEKLRRAVKKRDEKIKKLSDQLQSFMKTAMEVEKIVKHSKDQSGEIARLKKQLEVAETEKSDVPSDALSEAHVIQSSSESEALQRKLTESLTTVRRLHLQTKKLEDENKTLKDGAHMFANMKMAEVERENASLKEKAKEREEVIASMGSKLGVLSQQKAACEEQNRSLSEANKHLEDFSHHLEQKVIGQQASIQNIMQDLQVTKERASEAAVTLERYKQQNSELQKQCKDLQGEKEAMKLMAEVYKEDFNNERKDRESAHAQKTALEERFTAEVAKLKEQVQRVSADNGRLTKVMKEKEGQLQRQVQEMSQHIETLNANKNALQGEIQSKTQQVKQYKKQVDQFRGELDRCRAEMVAYKQQAEHHKQQIEGTVHRSEQIAHTMGVLQEENQRLKKDLNVLASREHLRQHAAQRSQAQLQGGREGSPINAEEFIKERRKHEEVVRMLRSMEEKLEELTVQKVMVESENEELKKCLSSSGGRSPPPVSQPSAGAGARPPPYSAGNRGQGGFALPNPMRPQHQNPAPNQRLNHQMKSVSVDSADILSSRGSINSAQYQSPIPSVTVASAIPRPPPTTRPAETAHRDQRYSQPPQKQRKSHTSTIPSPQRDLAAPPSFLGGVSNTNAQAPTQGGGGGRGRGYPSSFVGHSGGGGNVPTNADMGGGNGNYRAINSPPTNAKYKPPLSSSSGGGPALVPDQQAYPPQTHGAQLGPVPSQASTFSSNTPIGPAHTSSSSRVPPFTGHGASRPVGPTPPTVSGDGAQRHLYHNLPYEHQVRDQYNLSPPPDDGQGSGHMSLPSFGSGGFQQPQAQSPVHNHQQAPNHPFPHQTPKDDMYLLQQQRGGHGTGGYHHHHHHHQHPASESGGARGYHSAIDVVEKDSSPPSSYVPPGQSQGGPPLSLNPQALLGGMAAPHQQQQQLRHQQRNHLSPEHSTQGASQPRRVKADGQTPTVHGVKQGGRGNDPVQLAPHHGRSAQVLSQQMQQQQQQQHGFNAMGGGVANQQQRPHSHAVNVKGPIMESGIGPAKLPPTLQKQHGGGGNVYVSSQERQGQDARSQYEMKGHRPEPDSDSVSNVSMESGLNSPTGDGNENTLEKGIDGDIRRAARNIKKQMAGREPSVGGGGGAEAPYDPNLTCPSCGLKFRIGEIQKFKRHASTCTGT